MNEISALIEDPRDLPCPFCHVRTQQEDRRPIATTWMDLEGIMLSEINREKQISYVFPYMWNLKNKTNE